MSTEGHTFEVEKILKMRVFKTGERKFKLRWKGYPPSDDTWEVENNLDCPDLLNAFLEEYKKRKNVTRKNEQESTSDTEQPPYLEVPRPPALSWIYDDIYNCFKVDKKTLIVRLNDNHQLFRKYEQYDDEKENYYRCMSCSDSNSENDGEEYIYQSRAHRDDGLVYSEPHTETCQPISFETHGIQTRVSTSVSNDTEWYYHNSFTKFELFEANNNNDAPEHVKVYQEEDSYWMFIKKESNEFKCENCLKLGWTTLAKFVDGKVMTQSHHPICFIIDVPK